MSTRLDYNGPGPLPFATAEPVVCEARPADVGIADEFLTDPEDPERRRPPYVFLRTGHPAVMFTNPRWIHPVNVSVRNEKVWV